MKRYDIDFMTRVKGIPCGISVHYYRAPMPMQVTGTGTGDADPPEPEEFEYTVTDRTGYAANWLARLLTKDDEERILREVRILHEYKSSMRCYP